MTNTMKFTPGTYLEIDDGMGARMVVRVVDDDDATFWLSTDTSKATPLLIHPAFKPTALGTLAQFIQTNGLTEASKRARELLRMRLDKRQDDALFIMRMLHCLAPKVQGEHWTPDDGLLQWAQQQAEKQESIAEHIQSNAEQFHRLQQ
jgi:hypothetical protein